MDWVTEHLQLIIAVAGAVAWWLNQRHKPEAGPEESDLEKGFEDPELAERTRRIREEIQRKIEQRGRGHPQSQENAPYEPAEPPPLIREVVRREPVAPTLSRAAKSHLDAQRTAEILEQQAALMEQLRQAQELKAAALRRTQFESEVSDKGEAAVAAVRSALADDLRHAAVLRRAIILREVLGPPVALR
jgi:anti-sigma factor RsiW